MSPVSLAFRGLGEGERLKNRTVAASASSGTERLDSIAIENTPEIMGAIIYKFMPGSSRENLRSLRPSCIGAAVGHVVR